MRLHCIFIACLALFTLCSLASSQNAKGPDKCCFSYYNMRIPGKLIVSYKTTFFGCQKEGIIFIMKSGNEICANPKEIWAAKLKDLVDARINMTEVSSGDRN